METRMIDHEGADFMRLWERGEQEDDLDLGLNDEGEIQEDVGREEPTEGLPG